MPRYNEATNSKLPEQTENPGEMLGYRHFGDDIAGSILAARLQAFNMTTLEYEDVLLDDGTGGMIIAGATGGMGTQYTEDGAAPADPIGTAVALVRDDSPSAQVTTDGDIVMQRATNYGAAYVQLVTSTGLFVDSIGHPAPAAPVSVNATASGNTTVVAAPGPSLSLHICRMSVHNRDTTNRLVSLQDGAGGTTRWRAELTSEGGGSLLDFGNYGWKLTANTLLNVNLDSAGNVDVNVLEHYVAA